MTLSMLNTLAVQGQGQSSGLGYIWPIQLLLIALVFYFLILRPQHQARKKHEHLLQGLKKGDEVMTTGGLLGKVKDIKESRVTIESGTASVVVDRSRIVRVGDQSAPGAAG